MKHLFLLVGLFLSSLLSAQSLCDNPIVLGCGYTSGDVQLQENTNPISTDCGLLDGESVTMFSFSINSSGTGQFIYMYSMMGLQLQMAYKEDNGDCSGPWTCLAENVGFFGSIDITQLNLTPGVSYLLAVVSDFPDDQLYYTSQSYGEICDGIDNDCDGEVDEEGGAAVYFPDEDGDGFGSNLIAYTQCVMPAGFVEDGSDCDDTNPNINTSSVETCNGLDDNCNYVLDEGFPQDTFYYDFDQDGYGDPYGIIFACQAPYYAVSNNTDCEPYNPAAFPGGIEVCDIADNNCNGTIDEGFVTYNYYVDYDNDGYGSSIYGMVTSCEDTPPVQTTDNNLDCNDWYYQIYPSAEEICDGLDNNCDGVIDEGFDATTYYLDYDGDGFGGNWGSVSSCSPMSSYVTNMDDCGDFDPNTNPNATEICDYSDNDCDGLYNEGFEDITGYYDFDADGYGSPDYGLISGCTGGYLSQNDDDCNDYYSVIFPGAVEVCDGLDNNCDGVIDEGFNPVTYYSDYDQDGYGSTYYSYVSCTGNPDGNYWVLNNLDCVDYDANINPDGTEICDSYDNDCDGLLDEGFATQTYYYDFDQDGYGTPELEIESCGGLYYLTLDNTDCNDYYQQANPGTPEICDGIDNNCDGTTDEGFDPELYYYDYDMDGYGNPYYAVVSCNDNSVDMTYLVSNNTDCNDYYSLVNPAAVEICDSYDNNCDGQIDEGFNATLYYYDYDQDGYGDSNYPYSDCNGTGPLYPNMVLVGGDCLDYYAEVNPEATEVCGDYYDNDCDGFIDNTAEATILYFDLDLDGFGDATYPIYVCDTNYFFSEYYTSVAGDCNDYSPLVYPGAEETLENDIDDDCDGFADAQESQIVQALYADEDGDGFGSSVIPAVMGKPAEHPDHVLNNKDCHDGHLEIHPLGAEICNGHDDDCNGSIDDEILCAEIASWTAYPNPTTNSTTIALPEDVSSIDCRLFDAAGRLVIEQTLTPGNPEIDMSALDHGIYMVRILYLGEPKVFRIVKL